MSEAALLQLVARYPQEVALARRARGQSSGLQRLERSGLVWRSRGGFRVTARSRDELELRRLLQRTIARSRD
jgi:hypothetical protein